ncbi:MAG: hypothetical protein GWN32_01065 [Gemmatimonadetes bacterium]|nr:hypothetical protein [Gemmatimonadota bacterium]
MESEKVAIPRDNRRRWAVFGVLIGVSIVLSLGRSMSEAEFWLGGWAWYLAGVDFFCVASRTGDGAKDDEANRGKAEGD